MKKYFILLLIIFLVATPIFFAAAEYTLEMEYPSVGGASAQGGLVNYIRYIYLFALGIVGLAAFGAMVYGGFLYMLSGTNIVSQTEAKSWMFGAISGLVLALAAYLIMSTINPDLVSIKAPKVPEIGPTTPTMVGGTFMDAIVCKKSGACYEDNACTGFKAAGQCCCIQ